MGRFYVLATMLQQFTTSMTTANVPLNPQVTLSAKGGLPVTIHQRQTTGTPTATEPVLEAV